MYFDCNRVQFLIIYVVEFIVEMFKEGSKKEILKERWK